MSAIGTKRTSLVAPQMSAFEGRALLVSSRVLVTRIVKAAASGPREKGSSAKFGGPFRARSLALF